MERLAEGRCPGRTRCHCDASARLEGLVQTFCLQAYGQTAAIECIAPARPPQSTTGARRRIRSDRDPRTPRTGERRWVLPCLAPTAALAIARVATVPISTFVSRPHLH